MRGQEYTGHGSYNTICTSAYCSSCMALNAGRLPPHCRASLFSAGSLGCFILDLDRAPRGCCSYNRPDD